MFPKLRAVEANWIQHEGNPALVLRDPLGLADKALLVPGALATLLALCDGTRDLASLCAAFSLRTGISLGQGQVERLVVQLDEALLLESPRFERAQKKALADFREAPFRPPALAGLGYPEDPIELSHELEQYASVAFGERAPLFNEPERIRGLISPHIDFMRGGEVYAQTWLPARRAIESVDLVVVLGTDHAGAPGALTLTRQNYATPFGILPTARGAVDAVVAETGEQEAFGAELNHRKEHSIELALVWLHHLLGSREAEILPILCGSFHDLIHNVRDETVEQRLTTIVSAIKRAIAGRRVMIVAAADLAHVGPAFGDASPLTVKDRDLLRQADKEVLEAAATGSAEAFFAPIRAEQDRRRVCGLPPIYLMLRLLGGAVGELQGYAQCPADAAQGSFVSISGMIFRS